MLLASIVQSNAHLSQMQALCLRHAGGGQITYRVVTVWFPKCFIQLGITTTVLFSRSWDVWVSACKKWRNHI